MAAYYNEHDPYAAQWLRNLIAAGHIAPGDVDERSITEVKASELAGYTQCHFFAGIGVWSHALRRAGWADDVPVWSGSCPCQPFSAAGNQAGFEDARHLWPVWHDLIRECRPPIVVGEQVASALEWVDLVSSDLEGSGYAFGASDLCAAGFHGAHIRQRLYFVGMANSERLQEHKEQQGSAKDEGGWSSNCTCRCNSSSRVAHHEGIGRGEEYADARGRDEGARAGEGDGYAGHGPDGGAGSSVLGWIDADWLHCRDGKWRPVEPGTFPLAHEASSRVGRLRAYGNGLDAETATQFVGAVMECLEH